MIQLQKGKYQPLITKIWKWSGFGVLAFLIYIFAVQFNFLWLFGGMPSLQELENPKSQLSSILLSEDGVELGKYFRENRSPVEYEELSPNLIKALIATEDARFTQHSGVDLRSTFTEAATMSLLLIAFEIGSASGPLLPMQVVQP